MTQPVSQRDRSVCWQLMLLDLLRLSRAVGEALSGKQSGKQSKVLISNFCIQSNSFKDIVTSK